MKNLTMEYTFKKVYGEDVLVICERNNFPCDGDCNYYKKNEICDLAYLIDIGEKNYCRETAELCVAVCLEQQGGKCNHSITKRTADIQQARFKQWKKEGEQLRQTRLSYGLTIKTLAEFIGISQSTVSRIENGYGSRQVQLVRNGLRNLILYKKLLSAISMHLHQL